MQISGPRAFTPSTPSTHATRHSQTTPFLCLFLFFGFLGGITRAESGYEAWLRYLPAQSQPGTPPVDLGHIAILTNTPLMKSAAEELARGVRGMFGVRSRLETDVPQDSAIVLGTLDDFRRAFPNLPPTPTLVADGYWLKTLRGDARTYIVVAGVNDRGVLYGAFDLLRRLALAEPIDSLDSTQNPYAPVRMLDQWDNLDGSIERGYAGRSIFFEKDNLVRDTNRIRDYGRLMASVGINGISINNVNANTRVITSEFLPQLARVADVLRPWGVRLFVSIDFSSPKKIGRLEIFDPLNPKVAQWWRSKVDEIYRAVPDLGGFVLKADSEGRLGPSAYGRTHADAANVIARALKPHSGLLFYRGFVYDHRMDWRDLKNDRAKAAYVNFHHLDGKFDDNVVIQIKHGPIDFQVREPASPLFAGLQKTCQSIELQITQEYTGQQRHLCFLVPMWKEMLDFDLQAKGPGTPVKALAAGKTFHRPVGGFVGVANVGRDTNWLAHPLAMANLYGFGRLAWNPYLPSEQIAREWTELTFGHDQLVVDTIVDILLSSWRIYEEYTGPLGAGTLTDIINIHFGPAIESSEYNGWGQWHRADSKGIGMDRTVATGTGFIGQYPQPVAQMYESLDTCPDEVLLFMHHVPYTHRLHSGKTVIQHIYDSHYQGEADAEQLVQKWKSLKGRMDEQRYQEVLRRLEYQAGHAQVWRDAVCNWFLKKSGIPDEHERAGHFPNRIEAETMKLEGYEVFDVKPWEAASGGKAVKCVSPDGHCAVSLRYSGQPGKYNVRVEYFDQNNGASQFKFYVAGKLVDQWLADDTLPSRTPDAHTSTCRNILGVELHPDDEIRIEAQANGQEKACLDYIEIDPAGGPAAN